MKSLFAYLFTKTPNHLPLSVMIVISIILFYFLTSSIFPSFVPLEHQPAQAQSPDITTGLVGYWKFDEGSGTTASDSSGNGNTGTLVNGPIWTTGQVGGALDFDGTDDYINCGDETTLQGIDSDYSWTISLWYRSEDAIADFKGLLYKSQWLLNCSYFYGNNRCYFEQQTGDYHKAYSSVGSFSANVWQHIVVTGTGTASTIKFYINGVDQTATPDSDFAWEGAGAGDDDFRIAFGYDKFWNGQIDEVRVYNRALSAADVQELYNYTGAPSDTTSPTVSMTAPSNGSTVSGNVTVSANASDNVGVVGVQFELDGASLGSEDTTSPYSVSWNTTGTTNGSHTLTAVARDAAGNQTTSSAVVVTVDNPVSDIQPPSIPTGLTATAVSSSQINLSWTASTDNVGVTGYRIYRCQGAGCTPSTQIATSPTNSYSNTGLSPSTTYVYRVAAYDAAGNTSGQSSQASATTQEGAVSGNVYYVEMDTGSDSYSCAQCQSASTPKATIDSALGCVSAGDTIAVKGSMDASGLPVFINNTGGAAVYPSGNGVDDVGSISSMSGSTITISGSPDLSGVSTATDYAQVYDSRKGNSGAFKISAVNDGTDTITVENSWLPGGGFVSETSADPGLLEIKVTRPLNIVAWDNNNPPHFTTESSDTGRAFVVDSSSGGYEVRYVRFYNMFIEYDWTSGSGSYGSLAWFYGGAYSIVDSCDFYKGRVAIFWENYNHPIFRIIVQRNRMRDMSCDASHDCGPTDSTEVMYMGNATNPAEMGHNQITYNYFSMRSDVTANYQGNAVDIKGNSDYAVIWGNHFYNCISSAGGGGGVVDVVGSNAVIANNYFQDSRRSTNDAVFNPIAIQADDTTIFGNIFDGIDCDGAGASSSECAAIRIDGYWDSRSNVRIFNNVMYNFYGNLSGEISGISIDNTNDISGEIRNNIIQDMNNTGSGSDYGIFVQHGGAVPTASNNISYGNDTAWSGITCSNCLTSDPGMIDEANDGFSIGSGANAENAGYDMSSYAEVDNHDAANPTIFSTWPTLAITQPIERSGAWDIGAYEYTGVGDTTPPSTPTNLTATAISSSQINLSWTASTDNVGVTGYRIYRDGSQIATTANTSYSDTGLSPSTTYTYRVAAYDAAGNQSSQSASASATTPAVVNNLPIGNFDGADSVHITGWAYDQDVGTNPINVHIYIDGLCYQPTN